MTARLKVTIISIILLFSFFSIVALSCKTHKDSDYELEVLPSTSFKALTNIPNITTKERTYLGRENSKASSQLVYVLVNQSVYSALQPNLTTYKKDLETTQKITVEIYNGSWTNITQVRSLLQEGLSKGLTGAVLIGNIPIAWYWLNETEWIGYNETFPIDLYYMDLNGSWIEGEGTIADPFRNHTGDVAPEIWIGRLYASTAGATDEISALKNYFYKDHQYRLANLSLEKRALVYVDDDWVPWSEQWSNDMEPLYPAANRTLVNDTEITNATDYKARLTYNYEWISLFAHSGDWYHGLETSAGWTYVYNTDITTIDPKTSFYNLFYCLAANYSYGADNGYLGGHYIFNNTYGLVAVGSTKTGSMLQFQDFYNPLGQNKTIGNAFKEWFVLNGETGAGADSRLWFYGMTILGDPTLTPRDIFLPYPPDNIKIKIEGSNINLTWNSSLSLDVAHYNIYRSTTQDVFNFSAPYATTTNTTYLDVDAGEGNPNNYYYAVSAVDKVGNVGLPSYKVGKYLLPLTKGWNFIALPLNTTYKTAGELANAIPNCSYISVWNTTTQSFITYTKGAVENNFSIENGVGYLTHLANKADFYLAGRVIETLNVSLKSGWNSIGYLNESATDASTLSTKIKNCTCIGYWNFTLGRFVSYIVGTGIGNFSIARGNGYLISVTKESAWSG
ncbi:MAG: hypothetical protein AB1485_02770 [Candidatus Thermoplasmatota archaeon]